MGKRTEVLGWRRESDEIEEESAWVALPSSGFYPTLSIIIGSQECTAEELKDAGIPQREGKSLNERP